MKKPRKFHYIESWHAKHKTISRAIMHATGTDHWTVWNAPRPIYGHETWTGEFLTGVFYAAVDNRLPDAEWMTEQNIRNDAAIFVYHPWSEVEEHKARVCKRYDGVDPDEFDTREFVPSFQDWLLAHDAAQDIEFIEP